MFSTLYRPKISVLSLTHFDRRALPMETIQIHAAGLWSKPRAHENVCNRIQHVFPSQMHSVSIHMQHCNNPLRLCGRCLDPSTVKGSVSGRRSFTEWHSRPPRRHPTMAWCGCENSDGCVVNKTCNQGCSWWIYIQSNNLTAHMLSLHISFQHIIHYSHSNCSQKLIPLHYFSHHKPQF